MLRSRHPKAPPHLPNFAVATACTVVQWRKVSLTNYPSLNIYETKPHACAEIGSFEASAGGSTTSPGVWAADDGVESSGDAEA